MIMKTNEKFSYLFSIFVVLLMAECMVVLPASGQTDKQILKEMQEQIKTLQSRVTDLESQNAKLQSRLQDQEQSVQSQAEKVEQQAQMVEQQAQKVDQIEKKSETEAKKKPAIRSSFETEFYGFLKLDSAYDTARVNPGNFNRWVESDAVGYNDDQFHTTANHSRFGFNFKGPDFGNAKSSAKLETDFFGSGGTENKANLMMRHAYLQMDWPDSDFSIMAGQMFDTFSPLYPNTVQYAVGWWSGNIGYRRPQLRFIKGFALEEDLRLETQFAFSRTIGETLFGFSSNREKTGEDSGFPTMQGRVAMSFPMLTDKPTTIGLSGHFGQEEIDMDAFDNSRDMDTWSANIDMTIPLMEKLQLTGEAWIGENLDTYLGGIGQGIHAIDFDGNVANGFEFPADGLNAKGGWAALALGPWGSFSYNIGGEIDDPDSDELYGGQRDQNMTIFGNVFWKINEAITTGFEVSYIDTQYKNQLDGDAMRFQLSLMYKF